MSEAMMTNGIELRVQCERATAVEPTQRVCQVAAMFGLGVDEAKTAVIVPPTTLRIGRGGVVFITGASGGGKTTLLRLIGEQLAQRADANVIDFASLGALDDRPLVETIGGTLEDAVRWLALAGLNDAFVMLRRPSELSDGQRYRLRLAHAIAMSERTPGGVSVVLADEFGATLDRLTAQIIARNVRKWTRRSGVCFIAATTHDDLLEALEPDTLIVQHPGAEMDVMMRGDANVQAPNPNDQGDDR